MLQYLKQDAGEARRQDLALLTFSLLFPTLISVCVHFFFEPRWETNDDVGMSMVAHGYGIAAEGSPLLVYSNVIWGHIVRAIPSIGGWYGYSIATVGTLLVAGTSLLYFLLRVGTGYLVGGLAVGLILARPMLFPQFTINAGLLAVAAIVALHAYAQTRSKSILAVGCLLAFFSYLIRDQIFFLVVFIGLPFLPWRFLLRDRMGLMAAALLGIAVGAAEMHDRQAYDSPEWEKFNALHAARAPYTDYRAGVYLIRDRPDIAERAGYTPNDINLIGTWFFADPSIADPQKLEKMLDELGPIWKQSQSIEQGTIAVKALTSPATLPLVLAAASLLLLVPRYGPALCALLFIVAVFMMGLAGRPGILRVYFPLSCLILAATVLCLAKTTQVWRQVAGICILAVSNVLNLALLTPEAKASSLAIEEMKLDVSGTGIANVVAWGAAIKYEYIYPGFSRGNPAANLRIYSLGSLTLAPYAVAAQDEGAGRGFLELLRSRNGILMVAGPHHITMLSAYCKEHLKSDLRTIVTYSGTHLRVQRVVCNDPVLEPPL